MYVCVYICMYVCMYVCMYMYTCCMCVYIYLCIYLLYACVYVCMYVCIFMCIPAEVRRQSFFFLETEFDSLLTYMYVCMYVCIYIHIYIYIYIYMHIPAEDRRQSLCIFFSKRSLTVSLHICMYVCIFIYIYIYIYTYIYICKYIYMYIPAEDRRRGDCQTPFLKKKNQGSHLLTSRIQRYISKKKKGWGEITSCTNSSLMESVHKASNLSVCLR